MILEISWSTFRALVRKKESGEHKGIMMMPHTLVVSVSKRSVSQCWAYISDSFRLIARLGLLVSIGMSATAYAQGSSPKIDLRKIKAEETAPQVQVVANRLFSKSGRVNFGVLGGGVSTDPFLSVYQVGASLGYHFNDFLAVQLVGWKDLVSDSAALQQFIEQNEVGVNTVEPTANLGLELLWSPLYGKLNLLNAAILYADFHIGAGADYRLTENGNAIGGHITLGQDFYLKKWLILGLNYRALLFNQTVKEKIAEATLGRVLGTSTEISQVVSVNLGFLF